MAKLPGVLPASLRGLTDDAEVLQSQGSRLGAQIFHLEKTNGQRLFLKKALIGSSEDLHAEAKRLSWLKGQLSVPEVLFLGSDQQHDFVLVTELQGTVSHHEMWRSDVPRLMKLLAHGLKTIHSIPLAQCPFGGVLEQELTEAQRRIDENLLCVSAFQNAANQRTPQQVLEELKTKTHLVNDLVFTHGDYCMPNILIHQWELSGFVDWAIAGVSDRHRDLMCVLESVTHNCGEEWLPYFWEAYGLDAVDMEKIRFFQDLDLFYSDFSA